MTTTNCGGAGNGANDGTGRSLAVPTPVPFFFGVVVYIAIHLDAEKKPKAYRAAARLGLQSSRQFIVQVMCPLWMQAAELNGDGCLNDLDPATLTMVTFGAARAENSLDVLIEEGWLHRHDGKICVPEWEKYEPFFADRARKRKWREGRREARKSAPVAPEPPTPTETPTKKSKKEPQAAANFARALAPFCAATVSEGELCMAYNKLKATFEVAQVRAAFLILEKKRERFDTVQHVIGWFTRTIHNAAQSGGKSQPAPPSQEFTR